jgi:hypothetical protein
LREGIPSRQLGGSVGLSLHILREKHGSKEKRSPNTDPIQEVKESERMMGPGKFIFIARSNSPIEDWRSKEIDKEALKRRFHSIPMTKASAALILETRIDLNVPGHHEQPRAGDQGRNDEPEEVSDQYVDRRLHEQEIRDACGTVHRLRERH